MAKEYHVAKNGADHQEGTRENPFLTINQAAAVAAAGDAVIVHEGEYREWVKPKHAGLSNTRRITYQAADGEQVVIKGSEQITDWKQVEGTVWKTTLPNDFFGDYNPYKEKIFGDWVKYNPGRHLGDVYINGKSLYEAESIQELHSPTVQTEIVDHWTEQTVSVEDPEQTEYVWFAEVDQHTTTIYINCHGMDPTQELVEINVRKCCFYPEHTGIDYITVSGFEMAQAATPWTPPTADQPGLVGPHWSKGWIIENNIIHDSKCSAISIGKEASTGENYSTTRKDKSGYQYQVESIFQAQQAGWTKEKVGSHIIRHNIIYDCGQNAVVGHLGCVFSEIYNNHIYNIGVKREFFGHEIAGVKLHAAIDVQIYHNRIHDCSLGVWLDWQTQGTRVSSNLFYRNNRDLFVEVSSGPYVVDHNILTADYALDNHAQGGAYVNNLIRGEMVHKKMLDRATPYHTPHSTEMAGFAVTYGGDDRYFNNLFIGDKDLKGVGTGHYNGYTASLEEYIDTVNDFSADHKAFNNVEQPVYINNNAYLNGAEPFEREEQKLTADHFDPKLEIIEKGSEVYLYCELPEDFEQMPGDIQSTETLPRTRIVDADFESPDGSELILNEDYYGNKKNEKEAVGPINDLKPGENYIKVWG
ncbi:right-handed parallel beta-helix repeat-containing protein [Marinococcus luteus]|uniref:right-handed parallel beta-helix repeat-containing protein n=1 Tax=Marinococcus luteus TaxID=1122204 RepID=UPI002ACCBFBE|nr:right-handed parallel beta-helix repeat-containing protein [Marinococcus luteus]MDZ5784231.1 right-handed parallel beta-helix repeat-containing protein [Marinococcus luteus]